MRLPILPLIFLIALALSHPSHADIYVRNSTGLPGGDGTEWGKPFLTVNEALLVAAANGGDTIHVAGGNFYVDGLNGTSDPTATFTIPPNTTILGGYNPDSLGERSPTEFPTVLSGDVGRDDQHIAFDYVIEHFHDQRGINAYHVITIPDGSVTVSGCVITAGNASATTGLDRLGGGILMLGTNLTLEQCRLAGNIARSGGALACNSADELNFDRCNFSGNSAIDQGGCAFLQNIGAPVLFSNCSLSDSEASSGGAIYSKNNTLKLLNATFSRNAASVNGGAIAGVDGTDLTLTNTIIWNNLAAGVRTSKSASIGLSNNSTFTRSHCIIENLVGSDPLFIAPPNSSRTPSPGKDLELSPLSPAIDAGKNTANLLPLDLNAATRISQAAIDIGAYERQKGADRYVDASVAAGGDGSSWATAHKTLWQAFTAPPAIQPGDSIFVAEGVYFPDDGPPPGQGRNYEFEIPPGVTVAGGFPVGGGVRDRDSSLHLTILSGDIDRNDINFDGNFIPEDPAHVVGANSYNVVRMFNTTSYFFTTSLVGFTITAGVADNPAAGVPSYEEANGGGIYSNFGGHHVIDDCRIVYNQARAGGGVYIREAVNATISNCYIGNNFATVDPASYAGGIYLHGSTSVAVRNCRIDGNNASSGESALNCLSVDHLVIEDTVIQNHTGSGPATSVLGFSNSGEVNIVRTRASGNAAGAQVILASSVDAFNMRDSLIAGNHLSETYSAVVAGGAFETTFGVSLTNCTIAGNQGRSVFDKIRSSDSGTLSFANCVVTDTSFEAHDGALADVSVFRTHSLIEGFAADADGNLDGTTAPGFVDPQSPASAPTTAGNYALLIDSPLIEAGLNTATASLFDIAGNVRLFDADDDGSARVDIGAYEYPIVIPPPPVLKIVTANFAGARGLTTLVLESDTAGNFRAEYSLDLQTWLPAVTGSLAVGSNTLRIPGPVYSWPEDRVYFRVVLE